MRGEENYAGKRLCSHISAQGGSGSLLEPKMLGREGRGGQTRRRKKFKVRHYRQTALSAALSVSRGAVEDRPETFNFLGFTH